MARILPFERARRRSWRGGGHQWGEARTMVWAGLLLGLLWFNAARWTSDWTGMGRAPFETSLAKAPDPWAESRRSLGNLKAQEGAPVSARDEAGIGSGSAGHYSIQSAVRVVDGDTFWVAGEKVRIADIDTPETHPPRCAYEAALGMRATRRLETLLALGPFDLEPIADRDTDRYGRKLRIVTRGGRSIGDILVAEGLARSWIGHREPWCT
jgi:micrococcal nuclease